MRAKRAILFLVVVLWPVMAGAQTGGNAPSGGESFLPAIEAPEPFIDEDVEKPEIPKTDSFLDQLQPPEPFTEPEKKVSPEATWAPLPSEGAPAQDGAMPAPVPEAEGPPQTPDAKLDLDAIADQVEIPLCPPACYAPDGPDCPPECDERAPEAAPGGEQLPSSPPEASPPEASPPEESPPEESLPGESSLPPPESAPQSGESRGAP